MSSSESKGRRVVRVRPVPKGYAVFGHGDERVSEVFGRREDAVHEAELQAGADGVVLVEGGTGHVESEVVHHR